MNAPTDSPSVELLLEWRDHGDQQAIEEFVQRYIGRLTALVRSRLSRKLTRRLDAEDVAQSALGSFCVRVRDGRLHIDAADEPWQLLAMVATRKLFGKIDFHKRRKRSVNREESAAGDKSTPGAAARDPEPTADEVIALEEELELALRDFAFLHRQMIELRLQGYQIKEIAAETKRSERMVKIVIARFRECIERRFT